MGFLDKFLWSEQPKPQDECRRKIAGLAGFTAGREYWSYSDKPLRGIVVDAANRQIVLTGYCKFTYSDKTKLFKLLIDDVRQRQPELGYLDRNNLANAALDAYIAENSCFARLYDYTDILRCQTVIDGEIAAAAVRRCSSGDGAEQAEILGGGLNYRSADPLPAAVQLRLLVYDTADRLFTIDLAGDDGRSAAVDEARMLQGVISEMIAQADREAAE